MTAKRPFPPHLREFGEFLEASNKESERGLALISTAMIEDLLERSILAFLLDHAETKRLLQGFNAPLGTLSARALAALALGIMSESEYRDCERLRKIRNEFAHNVHASFEDQKIKDICANLEFSAKEYGGVGIGARAQFATGATALIVGLTNRTRYVAQQRLKYGDWSL